MRSVTPFRVVGLKTTGDCWHCWKATRSTLYIFLRLYFSSLFFTRSVFFLLSGSKHIGRNKSMFLQFSSNFSFRIRAYSSYVEIDERGSGIITRRYCLDRCGKFPLFFERRHVIRFWGSVNRRGGVKNKIYTRIWNLSLCERVVLCISDEVGHDSFERYLRCPFLSFQDIDFNVSSSLSSCNFSRRP